MRKYHAIVSRCFFCVLLLAACGVAPSSLLLTLDGISQPAPEPIVVKPAKPPAEPVDTDGLEARFNDDSALKLKVLDENIQLITPYGKLVIPMAHIQRIELATRLTDEEARRITQAIGGLADEDYEKREAATATLMDLGEKAYLELLKVSNAPHAEAARRAKVLIDKLRENVSEERLAASGYDIVHTAQSRIAGNLTAKTLRIATAQFGDLELKLADVRELRLASAGEPEPTDVQPDPGNLLNFQNQVGKIMHFRVTGATQATGTLYGTGFYTVDGNLAMSAVHAGAIKAGETKVVKVKILGQTQGFIGSTQNGFTSNSYSSYSAYEVVVPKKRK